MGYGALVYLAPMSLGKINHDQQYISITLVTTSMWYYLKSKHVLMTMFLLSHIVYIQATPHAIHRSSLNTEWRQLMVVDSVLNELEHLETFPLAQMMVSTSCNGSEENTYNTVWFLQYNIYGGEGGGGEHII